MADIKITELTALGTIEETDLLPVVSDPAGTPVTKKITEKDFINSRKLLSIVPAANFSLTASTSAQNALPTSGDVFTLEASTTYMFEGMYFITKSGSTCTTALSFALGGSASITSMKYVALAQNVAKNTTGATVGSTWVDRVAATVINATASTDLYVKFEGIIRMNAGGTVTPQITFSAAPTSPVMVADSFVKFEKIGTSTENTIGSVS